LEGSREGGEREREREGEALERETMEPLQTQIIWDKRSQPRSSKEAPHFPISSIFLPLFLFIPYFSLSLFVPLPR